MEQLHRCWIRRADPVAEKACSWLLQTMLWALCDEVSHSESNSWDQQMEEVKLMLDSDPEANVSIAELASACGISTEHFSRRFRRHAGTTAKNYQLQSRMRFARRLLQNEGLNVKEVASRLGYSDAFVFSRQFKKVWGVSPSNV
jgi:AraC-like DNA-binding protein